MSTFPQRVFSGVQSTGNLHLGNYLGAIVKFVELQKSFDCIYCVVDLHAITVPQDPIALKANTREIAAAFIACGIDPKENIVFNQSQVPEHAELAWVLNCVARIGWLNRMTQFKDKAGKDRENASMGLLDYPVLMAADILIYRATHVPVGDDQKQHLELARDIAQKFNNDFARIDRAQRLWRGLLSPARAADLRPGDARDEPARRHEENVEIRRFRLFAHQSLGRRRPDRAEGEEGQDRSRAAAFRGKGPRRAPGGRQSRRHLRGAFGPQQGGCARRIRRRQFLDASRARLSISPSPSSRRSPHKMRRIREDESYVDGVLRDGAERARAIARENMNAVKDIVGFLR